MCIRDRENPLEHHFTEQAKAENTYNLQVLDSIFNDNRVVCLAFKEETPVSYTHLSLPLEEIWAQKAGL